MATVPDITVSVTEIHEVKELLVAARTIITNATGLGNGGFRVSSLDMLALCEAAGRFKETR